MFTIITVECWPLRHLKIMKHTSHSHTHSYFHTFLYVLLLLLQSVHRLRVLFSAAMRQGKIYGEKIHSVAKAKAVPAPIETYLLSCCRLHHHNWDLFSIRLYFVVPLITLLSIISSSYVRCLLLSFAHSLQFYIPLLSLSQCKTRTIFL